MVARTIGVVQLLPELNEGGVEQGTLELGRHLVHKGHRSLVVSQGGRLVSRLQADGSRHIHMPYIGEKTPRCLIHLWSLRRLLAEDSVDVLHMRSRLPAWVGYLAWKSLPAGRRPQLVTTFHGFYSVNAYSAIMVKGQKVIAVSQTIADHINAAYHVPRERLKIIYRGVDPGAFDPQRISPQRIQSLRLQWGIAPDTGPVLLMPARVTRLKGHDLLIQALGRLRDRPWVLVCAGDLNRQSPYGRYLLELCAGLNLDQQIKFVDHCEDMPAAVNLADVVISASTQPESFGRTVVEAQAAGRPVIAPAHGGMLETVQQGHTGWLFTPGDMESLISALQQALGNSGQRIAYGRQARQWVMERFTLERMCARTLDLYMGLLAQ